MGFGPIRISSIAEFPDSKTTSFSDESESEIASAAAGILVGR